MDSSLFDGQWIWHPEWSEDASNSAGGFAHFRKAIEIEKVSEQPVHIQVTADTRYKLFINSKLVHMGPVKGDEHLWFYDELNIQPYLKLGTNDISIRVLRFHYSTQYATSFPRLPYAGLFVRQIQFDGKPMLGLQSDSSWESALDLSTRLRTDQPEDDFLHVYEDVDNAKDLKLAWVPAKVLQFASSHGLKPPWNLSARIIPQPQFETARFQGIRNLQSHVPLADWERVILTPSDAVSNSRIRLPAGTTHRLELEAPHHLTALISFHFERPSHAGSSLRLVYSECYEDEPRQIPYLRRKGDRCDSNKQLIGPEDKYKFGGRAQQGHAASLKYDTRMVEDEVFAPFHFRTLRFLVLEILVAEESDLVFKGIDLTTINYPLEVRSHLQLPSSDGTVKSLYDQLWNTSLRTLQNCLHDTYEDCPFYEQLQYAMDTRSSILFTYCVSGDDRLARQAIIQLHNTYQPHLGLTASRAPAHQLQIIPHFSLFWICIVADHFQYFADVDFARTFLPAIDGVLESFARRIDPTNGLVRSIRSTTHWDFVDWTDTWRPMGIPPAAARTGFCSFTSMLYAYCLKQAANLLVGVNRPALASEYQSRAQEIVQAIQIYCFDGTFYTDGLASTADTAQDYSQHSQIWAVLSGAAPPTIATSILHQSLSDPKFSPVSVAMSFYTLRALSLVGGSLYDTNFHSFWEPWKAQLALNLTTWMEDTVSLRSDCHAWGSTALYEFAAEVAGVRPAEPGWAILAFTPRVGLFPALDVKVPFGTRWGRGVSDDGFRDRLTNGALDNQSRTPKSRPSCPSGVAQVKWQTEENGQITLTLRLEMDADRVLPGGKLPVPPPVRMYLPDGSVEEVYKSSGEIVRVLTV